MSKIIIFGNLDAAELACFYFKNDSPHCPVAFCVDGSYIKENTFYGLPVIAFEDIESTFSKDDYLFHAPIYASGMNDLRTNIVSRIEKKGYNLTSYISSKAYTWNSTIGKNAFILEGCNIQPFCKVGNNNIIWSFTHIGHHSIIGDNNFISSHVAIAGHNKIGNNCFIGTNSTTRDGTQIVSRTFVGQDSSVVKDIHKEGVYVGMPAKYLKSTEDLKF